MGMVVGPLDDVMEEGETARMQDRRMAQFKPEEGAKVVRNNCK
jgi:hypothetical protein